MTRIAKKMLFIFFSAIILFSFKSVAAEANVNIKNAASIDIPNIIENVQETVYCNSFDFGSNMYIRNFKISGRKNSLHKGTGVVFRDSTSLFNKHIIKGDYINTNHYESVKYCIDNRIFLLDSKENFNGNDCLTRINTAKILSRLISKLNYKVEQPNFKFKDIDLKALDLKSSINYMTCFKYNGQYLFKPNQYITLEEILYSFMKLLNIDVSTNTIIKELNIYDKANVVPELSPYVAYAIENHWVGLYKINGKYLIYPKRPVTRYEIAELIYKLSDYFTKKKGESTYNSSECIFNESKNLQYYNGWLYFTNRGLQGLYRVQPNGKSLVKLLSDSITNFYIINNSIYYENNNSDIYKVNADGSMRKKLIKSVYNQNFIRNCFSYYSDKFYFEELNFYNGTKKYYQLDAYDRLTEISEFPKKVQSVENSSNIISNKNYNFPVTINNKKYYMKTVDNPNYDKYDSAQVPFSNFSELWESDIDGKNNARLLNYSLINLQINNAYDPFVNGLYIITNISNENAYSRKINDNPIIYDNVQDDNENISSFNTGNNIAALLNDCVYFTYSNLSYEDSSNLQYTEIVKLNIKNHNESYIKLNGYARNFCSNGKYIFFIDDNNSIIKFNPVNNSFEHITCRGESAYSFYINGSWIYYEGDENSINKVKIDGTNNIILLHADGLHLIGVINNNIYYTSDVNGTIKFCILKTDSFETAAVEMPDTSNAGV